ncbi:predicted protein [Naegleria gruberi]|uniref:Predicted protein n=1 Tax=Naegleria gruberi TaxID=5762 RepID=D2VH12_NAEGR|nr:uncharacterized protein NAEGRDRAFT_49516 [Naegleria gruberi]EFC43903.1 predicted protein [Naegleria gruberi]|eukprot:XP_002676647.1 predicted protein [Naegleria gruberi strain NEG-M]
MKNMHHSSKVPSPPSTPKFITLLENRYEDDNQSDDTSSLHSTTSSTSSGEQVAPTTAAFNDDFLFSPSFLPITALIPNFPVSSTSSAPQITYKEPTRKMFKKDELVWVEIKDKLYLAQVVRQVKNVQVIINERNISSNEILGGQEIQVDPSKCYPVDAPALNNLERENLMWASPGCHSLAQVVANWTNFVNKSFMDQLRSSQIFTCRSLFYSQQQVHFIFDLLYGSVISFIEERINLQIQTILLNWRRRCENTSSQIKEIVVFDLPTQTEADNLSDQFVELFNMIAIQSNAQNEMILIKDLLSLDQVQMVEQVMKVYESVNAFKTYDDSMFVSTPLEMVSSTCDMMKTTSKVLTLLLGDFVQQFGEDYLPNALESFEDTLFEQLTSRYISRSYFIHCMTFGIEKKTSNTVFNQCLSQLKQTGFPMLINLYTGDDKYGYKMKIEDQQELQKNGCDIWDIVKGDNFVYLTDETILQILTTLNAHERNEFNRKLHFVTDTFEDVFSNRVVSMFDIISASIDATKLQDSSMDEEFDYLNNPTLDEDIFSDPSINILEMDINVDNMEDEDFTFEIPPREMLYHAACYGLSSFAHVNSKMMDPISVKQYRLVEDSFMSTREYLTKYRSSDCSTNFSFDKDHDSIDYRDKNNKNDSSFSKKLMSKKQIKVVNFLNLENLKPDFSTFSKSREIISNPTLKRLFQSLSEQISDYNNRHVLEVRGKQIKDLVSFIADYWFTFLKDEKNVLSFVLERNGKPIDPILIILESVKMLNFTCVYSRQKEEIVKIIREEGLLNMLCEMMVRIHSERQGKEVNLKDLRNADMIELEQLALMTILTCVKKDKQACGYLSHEEYFWNFFKCLVRQIRQLDELIETNSSVDMKNITEIFTNTYMEILSTMISDPYSYQFLKFQTSEIVSSSKITTITKTIVHNIKNNNISLLLNPDFYNKITTDLIHIIQNFDKNSMRVNDFVTLMQNVIPFFSYNQKHLTELIKIWISQIEFRSAYYCCQCLRSLSKIYEKLRSEPASTISSLKKMILSKRYKDVIAIAMENKLIPIVKSKVVDLIDERRLLKGEKKKNLSKIQELNNSLENIVFALVYLSALYEGVRKQLVKFIFTEHRVESLRVEKESIEMLQFNDLSNKNVESLMKGLSQNANSDEFNQFSKKFINHWEHMSPINASTQPINKNWNQTNESLNRNNAEKRKSMFSIESLLNQSHSLNSSTLSQMNTSRQQLLSVSN